MRIFKSGMFIRKILIRLDLGPYWFWAILRVILTLVPQNGYIHPDEFFQSVEVFSGNVFKADVSVPWEFNATNPLRSVPVMYVTTSVPLTILKLFYIIFSRSFLSTYWLIVFPRLVLCILSFISDYCLYRICYLYGQNFRRRLLVFASSYVTLVYATRTFSNTLEMLLFNILLCLVASCMAESEKINYQDDFLKAEYNKAETTADQVRIWKLRNLLPTHSLNLCFPIALVSVAGVFNRPTFVAYAVPPIFYWLQRGIRREETLLHFHLRFFLLLLYAVPVIIAFIIFDSGYYGYITWGEILNGDIGLHSFVVTPLNFLRYNILSENLAQHGIHPRWLHVLVNLPLLFNLLAFAGIFVVVNMFYRGSQSYWSTLPKPQSITGMMTLSVLVPVVALSAVPHQEPRFIAPVLLPLVFLYSHLITRFEEDCPAPARLRRPKLKQIPFLSAFDNRPNIMGRFITLINSQAVTGRPSDSGYGRYELLKLWFILNIILTVFYGFIHQGAVYNLAKTFREKIETQPKFTTSHLIHTHMYPLPQYLLMQPITPPGRTASFSVTHLPGDPDKLVQKIANLLQIYEHVKKTRRRNYQLFYALPATALSDFHQSYQKYSEKFRYKVSKTFMPHLSLEAPFHIPDVFSLTDVMSCFQLVLLEIKFNDTVS